MLVERTISAAKLLFHGSQICQIWTSSLTSGVDLWLLVCPVEVVSTHGDKMKLSVTCHLLVFRILNPARNNFREKFSCERVRCVH